ncbi:hypothetical protein Cfor_04140, partial [Coptotermes formosanus]
MFLNIPKQLLRTYFATKTLWAWNIPTELEGDLKTIQQKDKQNTFPLLRISRYSAQDHGMGSPSSAVEAARRRLRDVVRRGEKLGLTRSDLVSLPAARRLTNCGSRWCWRSTSLAITALTVILAATAILTKCFVYHQPTTAAYPSGVSAASLDPWWQPQQFQRL